MNKRKAKKMQRKNALFQEMEVTTYRKYKYLKRAYHEYLVFLEHVKKRENLIVESIKKETGFNEEVVGCFVTNYRVYPVCPISHKSWCKDYTKCQVIESMCRELL